MAKIINFSDIQKTNRYKYKNKIMSLKCSIYYILCKNIKNMEDIQKLINLEIDDIDVNDYDIDEIIKQLPQSIIDILNDDTISDECALYKIIPYYTSSFLIK